MKTYISLLRGINVSGKNRLRMEDLRNLYLELGFKDVQTYIQSGNVVFRYDDQSKMVLANTISSAIGEKFGLQVPVLVRTTDAVRELVQRNPFPEGTDLSQVYITFLWEKPENDILADLNTVSFPPDEFRLLDDAIYVYCPGGYGRTRLNNPFFERKLKVTATTRNWRTTLELIRMGEDALG